MYSKRTKHDNCFYQLIMFFTLTDYVEFMSPLLKHLIKLLPYREF